MMDDMIWIHLGYSPYALFFQLTRVQSPCKYRTLFVYINLITKTKISAIYVTMDSQSSAQLICQAFTIILIMKNAQ